MPMKSANTLQDWFYEGLQTGPRMTNHEAQGDYAQNLLRLLDMGIIDAAKMEEAARDEPWFEAYVAGLVRKKNESYMPVNPFKPDKVMEDGSVEMHWESALAQRWLDIGLNPWNRRPAVERGPGKPSVPTNDSLSLFIDLGWAQMLRQVLARPDAPHAALIDAWRSTPYQKTPQPLLSRAVMSGRLDTVQVLLDHGCSQAPTDDKGCTALFHAPTPEQADLLLRQGAQVTWRNEAGQDAMQYWTQEFSMDDLQGFKKVWSKYAQKADTIDGRLDSLGATLPLDTKGRLLEALRNAGVRGTERGSNGTTLLRQAVRSATALVDAVKLWDGKGQYTYGYAKKVQPKALEALLEKCPASVDPEAASELGLVLLVWPEQAVRDQGMALLGHVALTTPRVKELLTLAHNHSMLDHTTTKSHLASGLLWDHGTQDWQDWVRLDPTQASKLLSWSVAHAQDTGLQQKLGQSTLDLSWFTGDRWAVAFTHILARPGGVIRASPNARRDDFGLNDGLYRHAMARRLIEENTPLDAKTLRRYEPLLRQHCIKPGEMYPAEDSFDAKFLSYLQQCMLHHEVGGTDGTAPSRPRVRL